jgi:hypothetical protein
MDEHWGNLKTNLSAECDDHVLDASVNEHGGHVIPRRWVLDSRKNRSLGLVHDQMIEAFVCVFWKWYGGRWIQDDLYVLLTCNFHV